MKSNLSKDQLRSIIEHYGIKTADDAMAAVKDMFAEVLQETLEAELDTELGYPKNGSNPDGSANRRNGHSKKTVRSTLGEVELSVPRDREGDFEPVIVKKHQKEVSGIEEMILGLYAKGVTVRDIQAHLNQLYGVDISPDTDIQCNEPDYAGVEGMAVASAAKSLRCGIP